MPKVKLNGISIAYEIIGNGSRNAIITPGGRFSKDETGVREFAEDLAKFDFKVVIWDRPNCGESDVCFEGENESALNADMLAALLKHLEMTPALVIGGSAGGRVSLMAIRRHPEICDALSLHWLSGGSSGLALLVGVYCGGLEREIKESGMEAAAKHWSISECIERGEGNLERFLAYDPDELYDTLQRWGWAFFPEQGSPIPGLLPSDFAKIDVPVLIFRSGKSDFSHPRFTTEQVHALIPGSKMIEPPWGDREWIERIQDEKGIFRCWRQLAPDIAKFYDEKS